MISIEDKNILRDVGREYLLDIAFESKIIKSKLNFKEHLELCNTVMNLSYEEVVSLTVTEDVKDFENKFKKFLKYSFAAVAGAVSGVFGAASIVAAPPIAMFILYTYRKLTDTCSRMCLKNIPMSTKRKICRYECQVNAAKKVTDELRKEINKCKSFAKPDKCEKSLRKEYIKWAKRLQVQIVKLQQARLGQEEKERRKRGKELANKAKTISSSLQLSKSQMLKMISESDEFRKNLNFKDHVAIYNAAKSLDEQDNTIAVTPPKIDPKKEKIARQALYLGLWIIPIPFFNDVVNYLIKKYSFSCITKCLGQKKYSKSLCISQCSYLSAKYAVQLLNSQMSKCNKADKPVKCKKKILSLLKDWKQRETETKIKFDAILKSELRKAQELKNKGKV